MPIRDRSQQARPRSCNADCPMAIVLTAPVALRVSRSNSSVSGCGHRGGACIGKPHPEGFFAVRGLLGIKPTDILVFEDSVVGIRAAQAAEMRCVGVIGTHDAATLADEGVHTVEQLGPELIALL